MLLPEEFASLVPFWNFGFFLVGVPVCLWINNRTRSDLVCVAYGVAYMVLYYLIFPSTWDEWLFFGLFGMADTQNQHKYNRDNRDSQNSHKHYFSPPRAAKEQIVFLN